MWSGVGPCTLSPVPAEGIHQTSLREASASQRLAPAARRCLVRYDDAGRLGAILLDLPYFDRYVEEVIRYVARLRPLPSRWGDAVHHVAAVPIVFSMLARSRRERSPELAAVALGLASHAAIDRQLHPLINALARRHADGLTHAAAHREVEKFQSICFHESYFGEDRMGTPGIVRLVQVPARAAFRRPVVADAVEAAFRETLDAPPSGSELARMGRGYEQHAALIGSPVGLAVAPPSAKERARPKFLFGAWGAFDAVLAGAIERSVDVLERAWAVFEASTDADAARAAHALRALLAPGSIDPAGEDLSLDAPFVPALPAA